MVHLLDEIAEKVRKAFHSLNVGLFSKSEPHPMTEKRIEVYRKYLEASKYEKIKMINLPWNPTLKVPGPDVDMEAQCNEVIK